MNSIPLNTNKQRAAYWAKVLKEAGMPEIDAAMSTMHEDTAKVLRWHYMERYTFKEITQLLNRSISTVRNHHDRGIFKLYKHFNNCHSF